jgi:hypothetical protein
MSMTSKNYFVKRTSFLFGCVLGLILGGCEVVQPDQPDLQEAPEAHEAQLAGDAYAVNIQSSSVFFWSRADLGQSFKLASAMSIRAVDGCFTSTGGPHHVALRSGDTITGPVIATTTQIVDTLEPCVAGSTLYTYQRATFSTNLALTAGASYTAHFTAGGPTGTTPYLGVWVTFANPYSGGIAMDYFGGAERRYPGWDAIARVVLAY